MAGPSVEAHRLLAVLGAVVVLWMTESIPLAVTALVGPVLARRPEDSVPWVMPSTCPVCGSQIHREEEEAVWRCENV